MPAIPGRPALAVRMLRAAGSLAALLILLVGVPLVLAWAGTLPDAIPSPADIADTLVSADDGVQVLFTVLTVAAWLLWLWFVLSVLAELPALFRRRPTRRRSLGAAQRLASFLLGGLLLVPAGTAVAAAAPAQAVSAPVLPQQAAASDAPRATAQSASVVSPSLPVHVVGETGETVWDLAVEYLGAGTRSAEIRQLNPHLPDTALLPAGTQITLPADARAPHPPASHTDMPGGDRVQLASASSETRSKTPSAGSRAEPRSHIVSPGETISGIAKEEAGDATNWSKLYEASRGAQPHGLPRITDPDLIFPGQKITIPAAVAPDDHRDDSSGRQDQEQPPKSDDQHPSSGAGSDHGDNDAADEQDRGSDAGGTAASPTAKPTPEHSERPASPSARPSEKARPSAPATSAPAASTPGQEHSPTASQTSAENDSSSVVSTRTTVGAFALLAAALTGTLAFRRLRQRRSRRPGQSLPQTVAAPVEAELELAAGDGSAGVLRLQAALSALASQTEGTPPPLRAARITADDVQVLPEDVAAEPMAPFTTSRAGWWGLPGDADLPVPEDGSVLSSAPYPALVTLGADSAGALVLANLPELGVLLVDGAPADRTEVIACLATELAIGPFAEHVEVVACGMGSMGADLAALGVQYLPDPRLEASEFAGRVLEAHQEPAGSALPYVMLCGSLDDDVAWQFAQTLDKARGLVPAVLVLPATASAMFPDAETIDATTSESQRIDTIGCDIVLQRLDAGSIAELANAYRQSRELPVDADGVWEHVPPETTALPDPAPPVVAVPDPVQDSADEADPRPANEEQAAGPVGFQALLGAAADPGQAPLRAVQAPPAPSAEAGASGDRPERIGPRFRIPPSYAILAPERVAALPETDEDKALSEAGPDDTAPRVRILGGLHVEPAELEPRLLELAAHLLLRPGSSAEVLCEDLGGRDPWSLSTLNSRLRELRKRLGTDPDGALYVPQRASKASPYALSDKVRCDWNEFERLAELGVSRGEEGLRYLERALALVGGVPLGEHASSWMVPLRSYMQDQIVDVACTVATYRTLDGPHQDFPSARQACAIGLSADSLSETLYRAMLKIEAEAGNRTGLRNAVTHWQDATRHLSEVDAKTQALVDKLLSA
ncbi:LysM peptidoglycan-binding domain-containing protein [Streptomyces sp. NPDC017964]|uniref:LysM peptidoglycan-binding domain-containing protein n=1 Tax=Streptomyces sp. NPDC017964 TaxID=3365022 RepID=UPI0037A5E5EE